MAVRVEVMVTLQEPFMLLALSLRQGMPALAPPAQLCKVPLLLCPSTRVGQGGFCDVRAPCTTENCHFIGVKLKMAHIFFFKEFQKFHVN